VTSASRGDWRFCSARTRRFSPFESSVSPGRRTTWFSVRFRRCRRSSWSRSIGAFGGRPRRASVVSPSSCCTRDRTSSSTWSRRCPRFGRRSIARSRDVSWKFVRRGDGQPPQGPQFASTLSRSMPSTTPSPVRSARGKRGVGPQLETSKPRSAPVTN